MELETHLKLDRSLNGKVVVLEKNYAKIALTTTANMASDEEGLIHGGFLFCAADFAAMAAVNDPFVVLAKSETKFLGPVEVGDTVLFEGKIVEDSGRKQSVEVVGMLDEKKVFAGTFYTVILEKHVFNL